MHARLLHAYLISVGIVALTALGATDWTPLAELGGNSLSAFSALVLMAVVSEALAVRLGVGKSGGSTSVTFIPLLASLQLFGPAAAVTLLMVSATFTEFLIRKKPLERAFFNVTQVVVATFAGGWVFVGLGGVPLQPLLDANLPVDLSSQFIPFMAFGLVFLVINHAAVSLAIALSQALKFSEVWRQMLGRSGASLHDFLISPIAIGVAFLYVQLGLVGILVAFLPLLFVRHAYLDAYRLREANAALLKALVKAIETRDPYTSGHSLRVAELSKRIAEKMGIARRDVDRIEQAALLHDIGKIEAAYTRILGKPSSLTPEERAVIQSHVTKGEELLRNLSSFPEDVLLTVRHHHERYDGAGYPDGLQGHTIPLGARIVAVCDAVDAMLSDRPYRPALSLDAVRDQLTLNSGRQFAPEVAEILIETNFLEEYTALLRGIPGRGRQLEAADSVPRSMKQRFPGRSAAQASNAGT